MSVEVRLVGALSAEPIGAVAAERSWTVRVLKSEVERVHGVLAAAQRLLLEGRPLRDTDVLGSVLPVDATAAELQLVRLAHAAVVSQLAQGQVDLEDVDEELRGDFDVVMAAVRFDGHALRDASEELRGDRDLAVAAVQECSLALRHASAELRGDRELVLLAVDRCGGALRHASAELLGDAEALEGGGGVPHAAFDVPVGMDGEVVTKAVKGDTSMLSLASASLRSDRDFMLSMVTMKGSLLEFATEDLRKDRGLVLAAVANDPYAFAYAARTLQSDRVFVLKEVIPVNGCAIQFASSDIKKDPDVLALVKRTNPEYFAVPRHGQ